MKKLNFHGKENCFDYLEKHFEKGSLEGSLGDFVKKNKDKIEKSGENYILKDRKAVFYYDCICSGSIVGSLKDMRDEAVLGVSDLNWFFNELKERQRENKEYKVQSFTNRFSGLN